MASSDNNGGETNSNSRSPRVSWKWLVMLVVTGVIIYLLVHYLAGTDNLVEVVRQAKWPWLAVAGGFTTLNFLFATLHWQYILKAMDFEVPLGRALRVIVATRPFDLMAPSRANDLLRPWGIRDLVPVVKSSGSVLAQRVIDVQSLCLLGIVGAAISGLWTWAGLIALGLVGGWVAVWLLFGKRAWVMRLPLVGRFEDKIARLSAAFVALGERPVKLAMASGLSLGSWSSVLGLVWALTRAFGAEVGFVEIGALWPLATFAGMLPLTVAGMGTRDAAFLSLLELTRSAPVDHAPVLATTLGYSLATTWVVAAIGIPFMLRYMYQLPEAIADDEDRAGDGDKKDARSS